MISESADGNRMDTTPDQTDVKSKGNDNVDARSLFNSLFGKESKPVARISSKRDDIEYNMKHKNRGKCIIISNKTFDAHLKLSERRGTDVDADNLYWRFYKLGFKVEKLNDLTKNEMTETLEKASKEDHSEEDCFVCCILSHGDQGVVYGRDGKLPIEIIYEPFRADNCSTLAGKPKLFFFQACQGDKLDEGTNVVTDSGSTMKIPNLADFLMAYSTVPGYYSWRNTSNGSWFIQGLCSVLEQAGETMDVLSMMTYVNQFVAYGFESCVPGDPSMHQMKQVPYITFTLTRKVFFRPKNILNAEHAHPLPPKETSV